MRIIHDKEVLLNKSRFTTSEEVYNSIYTNQLLEVFKIAISFLISSLLVKLLDNSIFVYYKKNYVLSAILACALLIAVILLAGGVFTYLKISNEKNDFLNKLTSGK
jgi:hypothetical protein